MEALPEKDHSEQATTLANKLLSESPWEESSDKLSSWLRRTVSWGSNGNHNTFRLTETKHFIRLVGIKLLTSHELELHKYMYGDGPQAETLYWYDLKKQSLTVSQQVEHSYTEWASRNLEHPELPADYLIDKKDETEQWQQFINALQKKSR